MKAMRLSLLKFTTLGVLQAGMIGCEKAPPPPPPPSSPPSLSSDLNCSTTADITLPLVLGDPTRKSSERLPRGFCVIANLEDVDIYDNIAAFTGGPYRVELEHQESDWSITTVSGPTLNRIYSGLESSNKVDVETSYEEMEALLALFPNDPSISDIKFILELKGLDSSPINDEFLKAITTVQSKHPDSEMGGKARYFVLLATQNVLARSFKNEYDPAAAKLIFDFYCEESLKPVTFGARNFVRSSACPPPPPKPGDYRSAVNELEQEFRHLPAGPAAEKPVVRRIAKKYSISEQTLSKAYTCRGIRIPGCEKYWLPGEY